MKAVYCPTCKDKHFNNYECSGCGLSFSCVWPTVTPQSKELAKYCPRCGHKFKKPNYKEKTHAKTNG